MAIYRRHFPYIRVNPTRRDSQWDPPIVRFPTYDQERRLFSRQRSYDHVSLAIATVTTNFLGSWHYLARPRIEAVPSLHPTVRRRKRLLVPRAGSKTIKDPRCQTWISSPHVVFNFRDLPVLERRWHQDVLWNNISRPPSSILRYADLLSEHVALN